MKRGKEGKNERQGERERDGEQKEKIKKVSEIKSGERPEGPQLRGSSVVTHWATKVIRGSL